MSIDENLMNDLRLFLEALPADLGRGSLNGMRVQLLYKVRANLQAAKPEQPYRDKFTCAARGCDGCTVCEPEQAQTAVGLPEPDFDALARIRDEAIGELLKKLFNAAVKYAGTSGAGYSPASADAYHAAEEIKTQITSTVTAYSPTQAEIESYATAKTAEAVRELVERLFCCVAIIHNMGLGATTIERQEANPESALNQARTLLTKYAPSNGKA